jgi:malate dehydrogenase
MDSQGWVSMAIPSDGSYGIPEGLMYSFPVITKNGDYQIVQGLTIDEFSRSRMQATQRELEQERDAIAELIG